MADPVAAPAHRFGAVVVHHSRYCKAYAALENQVYDAWSWVHYDAFIGRQESWGSTSISGRSGTHTAATATPHLKAKTGEASLRVIIASCGGFDGFVPCVKALVLVLDPAVCALQPVLYGPSSLSLVSGRPRSQREL